MPEIARCGAEKEVAPMACGHLTDFAELWKAIKNKDAISEIE